MAELSLKSNKNNQRMQIYRRRTAFGFTKTLVTVFLLLGLQTYLGDLENGVRALSIDNKVAFTYMDDLDIEK